MTEVEARTDVVVVGGGLAGLVAAIHLARGGRQVRLFEKAAEPGGRARTRTLDGFHLNLGPHALYRGGRGTAVLRELGVRVEGAAPRISGRSAYHSGELHRLPIGLASLLGTGLLRAKEKLEAGRLLAGLRRIDLRALRTVTLADWLRDNVESPVVRDLLAALLRLSTYTDDPSRASAGAALGQLRLAEGGVLYLHGGWQTLVDGLRSLAVAGGVEIVTHCPVASVERDSAVRGVRLGDGSLVAARAVVLACSPRMAADLASAGGPTALGNWAERAVPVRAACLDVALRGLPRPDAPFALGIDEPLYASVHSAVARLAPDGSALVQLTRYGGLRGEAESAALRQLTSLLDRLQPGWRGHVLRQRFLPDLVVSNAVVAAREGGLEGRPHPDVAGVPGLYVAGDWVGPEGMLADASLASAHRAATMALADLAARPAA